MLAVGRMRVRRMAAAESDVGAEVQGKLLWGRQRFCVFPIEFT